jgi:hypothetical protein
MDLTQRHREHGGKYMRFKHKDGDIVYVSQGPAGNYTFYKSHNPDKQKGHRMKIRILPQWYSTLFDAERALRDYARKTGLAEA